MLTTKTISVTASQVQGCLHEMAIHKFIFNNIVKTGMWLTEKLTWMCIYINDLFMNNCGNNVCALFLFGIPLPLLDKPALALNVLFTYKPVKLRPGRKTWMRQPYDLMDCDGAWTVSQRDNIWRTCVLMYVGITSTKYNIYLAWHGVETFPDSYKS